MPSSNVQLFVYDLSRGLAATLSPLVIGKKIDGIWHTAIVVYEREYFFGSRGVESCVPGSTVLGSPLKVVQLGKTQVPYSTFINYITGLSQSSYAGNTYNLFHHNCNNFSDDIAQFLCGANIPKYILDLPKEVINSGLAKALPALVSQLEASAQPIINEQQHSSSRRETSPDFDQLNSQIEEARYNSFILEERRKTLKEKLLRKERKKEKKRKKLLKSGSGPLPVEMEDCPLVENEVPPAVAGNSSSVYDEEDEDKREEEEKKKSREPPVVFRNIFDAKVEFEKLLHLVDGKLAVEEMKSMEELQVYLFGDEGSWALSDGFLTFIGRLLRDDSFSVDVRVTILNILAVVALKDDVILVLHQDRKDHILMNYAFELDQHSREEQLALAAFIANMFENLSSSEWLMYISEWTYKAQQISNIRVTTKVAVHSLLSDTAKLQEVGAAIVHNLACKDVKSVVFDDVAVELTMALLQYFILKPAEEQLFRCMKALSKFTNFSGQEVTQLIQMIGPDPREFKGVSERIDACINDISIKLPAIASSS